MERHHALRVGLTALLFGGGGLYAGTLLSEGGRSSQATQTISQKVAFSPSSTPTLAPTVVGEGWQSIIDFRADFGEVNLGNPAAFVNADCGFDPATEEELVECIQTGSLLRSFLEAEGVNVDTITTENIFPKVPFKDLDETIAQMDLNISQEDAQARLGDIGDAILMTFRQVLENNRTVLGTAPVKLVDGPTSRLDELDVNQNFWQVIVEGQGIRKLILIQDLCENPAGIIIPVPKVPTPTATPLPPAPPVEVPLVPVPPVPPTPEVTPTPVPTQPPLPTATPRVERFDTPTPVPTQPPLPTATPRVKTPIPTPAPTQPPLPTATPRAVSPTEVPPTPRPAPTPVPTSRPLPTIEPRNLGFFLNFD